MAGGRPTKYKRTYNEQAYKLCLLGATDAVLADFFEVNEDTINEWKKVHPKFSESLKKGKIQADAEVAERLFLRAKGYEHPEDKIFCTDGEVTIVKTTKHYPPDTAAAFIWLKNRAGWIDKQEYRHSGEISLLPPQISKNG
ncbi:hypothetical protein LCGC14_0400280 [marine sediment metagenome]|uniref:Terminase n=1 Tax=marine sediment metagenome TaxID=412755 RepID=A0A0F9W609_9ZZZZ